MSALQVEHVGDVTVARVSQDIDAANASRIGDRIATALPPDSSSLVLDLTACPYLDSAGIDMIFRLGQRMRERRRALSIVIPPSSPIARVAEIVRLGHEIPVHPTTAHALGRVASAEAPR